MENLKSLKGAPEYVMYNFDCHDNENLKDIYEFPIVGYGINLEHTKIYTIENIDFNSATLVKDGEYRFIVKPVSNHYIKFSFYFMMLNRDEHKSLYIRENIPDDSDEVLYYISNPYVEFNLTDF